MRYFLVTTEHLDNKVWFRDFDDFRTAMNLVAEFFGAATGEAASQ